MDRNNIDALLGQVDLIGLVQQAGGQLKKNGDSWRCACPLHGGANESSFAVFIGDDGLHHWKCFSDCNTGGDAIEFVKKWKGLDFLRAVEFLGGKEYKPDPEELARIAAERNKSAQERAERERRIAEQTLADLRHAEKHLYYHEHAADWVVQEWRRRGLDEGWQGFWYLGGCEDFIINDGYHTPTITIPIFNERRDILNIRHRLIKPQNPNDKYRPERAGLKQVPFLALPELGFNGDEIVVVEGEIKAAVTYSIVGSMDIQVIGVPGQGMYKHLTGELKGKRVTVCPDPGAEEPAFQFARAVGGRYFTLPGKIDDYILETNTTQDDLFNLIKFARKA